MPTCCNNMATLSTNLKRRATSWAGQLTKLAKGYAPAHLQASIHTKVETTDTGFVLRLGVTNNRPTNPSMPNFGTSDARAQEYGSGKQAQRRDKKFISIDAVNKPNLVFPGTHGFEGQIIVIPHVNHPGIHATNNEKGYLRPAVADLRKRMKAELAEDVRDAIRTSMRIAFKKFEE